MLRLYYLVQTRGYFGGSWFYLDSGYYGPDNYYIGPVSPNDDYFLHLYGLVGNNGTLALLNLDISDGGKADFRVQSFIGYYNETVTMGILGKSYNYTFTGELSDWSPTQTLTIPANNPSPTSSPTVVPAPTDSLPNMSPTSSPNANSELTLTLTWVIIGVFVVSVISLLLYVRHLKRRLPKN